MPPHPVQMGSGSAKKDPPAVQVDPKAAKPKPVPTPLTPPAARAKGKKKASKKKAAKKVAQRAKKPVVPPTAKEVDAAGLEPEEARKRCAAIYKFERKVEGKRKIHELAAKAAKAAKAALTEAEEALEQEIREQRFGPGPLFPVK